MRPLSVDSPRRIVAAKFGAELRKAMVARGIGAKRLAAAIHTGTSAVAVWRAGDNLPRTDTVARLADVLAWPQLVTIVRLGRVGSCARCGREFVNEGGAPKRYCSSDCRDVAAQLREAGAKPVLAKVVADELERVHGTTNAVSRRTLAAALEEYRRSESKRNARSRTVERRVGVLQSSVDAMCAGCEPLRVCRTPDCALRAVSPLPLALDPRKTADEPEPVEGAWGPTHRPTMLAAIRGANAERWARPGERETARARMVARYAAETPEEKAERARRVSEGRRRAAG